MINLIEELEKSGFIDRGYLCYEESDKSIISKTFFQIRKEFIE